MFGKLTEYGFEPKSYGLESPVLTSYASCPGLMLPLSQQAVLRVEFNQQDRGTDARSDQDDLMWPDPLPPWPWQQGREGSFQGT